MLNMFGVCTLGLISSPQKEFPPTKNCGDQTKVCFHLKFPEFPFQMQAAADWPGVRREVDVASHNVRQLGSLLFEMEVSLF